MDEDTVDPVIAVACSRSGHVLVTNDGDFKEIIKRLKITRRSYHDSLHVLALQCDPVKSADRLKEALTLIEHEWALVTGNRPLRISITNVAIRTVR